MKRVRIGADPLRPAWARARAALVTSETVLSPHVQTPCLLWPRPARGDRGYGRVSVGGRLVKVHRLGWEVERGPIPDGLSVLHVCDQPACANIEHLRLGTHDDAMAECSRKGRKRGGSFNRGTTNGRSRLGDTTVAAIRTALADGSTHESVARRFDVSRSHVTNIANGKRWRAA